MPVDNGVGHSEYTPNKQYALAEFLALHIRLVEQILANPRNGWVRKLYLYVDSNAGPGLYNDSLRGSPIIFLDEIRKHELQFQAFFVERSKQVIDALDENITERYGSTELLERMEKIHLICADNKEQLPLIVSGISRPIYGLIYIDPNGLCPFDILAEISNMPGCKFVDLLINLTATGIKRSGCGDRVKEQISKINKKYWMIRDPVSAWQWTMLLGTNWDKFPCYRKIGFHRLDEPEGQTILERISYTNAELASRLQPPLPHIQ